MVEEVAQLTYVRDNTYLEEGGSCLNMSLGCMNMPAQMGAC